MIWGIWVKKKSIKYAGWLEIGGKNEQKCAEISILFGTGFAQGEKKSQITYFKLARFLCLCLTALYEQEKAKNKRKRYSVIQIFQETLEDA